MNRSRNHGFTLIEVLVVLSLSAIVMLMVGSAVQLHLRMTDSRGNMVKNAQLARMILRQIGNDLRATTFAATASGSGGSGNGGSGSSGSGSSGSGNSGSGTSGATPSSQQIDPSSQTIPGLYGDNVEIRIDMLRAFDTREWFAVANSDTQVFETSIVPKPFGSLQTVAYFLSGSSGIGGPGAQNTASGGATVVAINDPMLMQAPSLDVNSGGGLIRQVVDHPIASWALQNGDTELDGYSQLFAPEVVSITFRYFDGTQWSDEWDSYVLGGLPVAVEVTLVLTTSVDNDDATFSTTLGYQDPDAIYTTVIHLPTALPAAQTGAQI